jgi:enamine deaminase RidA (YjgF/YER057c/UK114 family)
VFKASSDAYHSPHFHKSCRSGIWTGRSVGAKESADGDELPASFLWEGRFNGGYVCGCFKAVGERPRRFGNRIHNGIYYFSGTGSNDGYPKEDHVLVTDPFEKHVTRSLDALKKSLERAGSNMDSILNMQVFICLPHADSIPMPTGSAKFAAYKEHYEALNKIYGTYFSQGKAPSRAFMAVEWIPGDSLVEFVGSALVVNPQPEPPAAPVAPVAPKGPAGV